MLSSRLLPNTCNFCIFECVIAITLQKTQSCPLVLWRQNEEMLIDAERLVTVVVRRVFFLEWEHFKIISFKWKSSESTSKSVLPSK